MKTRKSPQFSKKEKEGLLRFLREALPQTTRRVVGGFLDDLSARIDRSPEETDLLRFSVLCAVARAGDGKLSRGLIRSLEYQAEEMELSDDSVTATELKALAHIVRERRGKT